MLMRISIRKHNQAYLQELASQMGVADITEVLNYLLLDVKGLGYSLGQASAYTTTNTASAYWLCIRAKYF
jgi:hypothetical protein